jgi:hypothetical protein
MIKRRRQKMAENLENKEELEEFGDYPVLTLTDEESGEEKDFLLLASHKEGEQLYYALTPDDEESNEYIILKVFEDGEDILFETVTDDDEFEKMEEIFNDMLFDADVDYDA